MTDVLASLCYPCPGLVPSPALSPIEAERVSLLNNELKIRAKKYLVQSRSFAEMLEATIRRTAPLR